MKPEIQQAALLSQRAAHCAFIIFYRYPIALFVAAAVLAPVKGRIEGIEIATVQFILDNAERFTEPSNLSKWLPAPYSSVLLPQI